MLVCDPRYAVDWETNRQAEMKQALESGMVPSETQRRKKHGGKEGDERAIICEPSRCFTVEGCQKCSTRKRQAEKFGRGT